MSRIKTPTILQMENVECGAAALAIILAYYQCYVPLTELRIDCGVSRDGSRADNMLKAARRYGMKAQGGLVEDWNEVFDLTLPCIVFWQFNHFVVIDGREDNKIYLNDPAIGPRVVSPEEFDRSFTGVVLLLEPDKNFQKGGEPPSILKSIKQRLEQVKNALLYIIIVSLALVIPGIIIPGFSKVFIDDILLKQTPYWFIPLLLAMAITAILKAIFSWLQQIHLLRLQTKLLLKSSMHFVWHVLRLPLAFFTQRYTGDIIERVSANNRIAEILSGDVSVSIVSLISMVFYALIILLICWPLGLFGISVAVINAVVLYFVSLHIANRSYQYLQENGKLAGVSVNGLQVIETLKASGAEDAFFQRWSGLHARTLNSQQQIALYGTILQLLPQFLNMLTTIAVLGLGGYLVMQGYLTLGSLVALQILILNFNAPLQTLLNVGGELPKIRGDLARLEDVLHNPLDQRFLVEEKNEVKITGELKLSDVSFGYSALDPPLIKNFSLTIKPGNRIAIIGSTASGKSTIAKLIANLYQPWSGNIELANQPLQELTPNELAKSIALVDQDICLLSGTVRENITLWNKTISDADIEHALQLAGIADVVSARGGLDAEVQEKGLNFSGGQRQRLEIARALVTQPAFLILDEATSALDPIIENEILNNLKKENLTLIIITHRLSAIQDCDQIIVLKAGEIAQRGTHEELMRKEGIYRSMYES